MVSADTNFLNFWKFYKHKFIKFVQSLGTLKNSFFGKVTESPAYFFPRIFFSLEYFLGEFNLKRNFLIAYFSEIFFPTLSLLQDWLRLKLRAPPHYVIFLKYKIFLSQKKAFINDNMFENFIWSQKNEIGIYF